MTMTVGSLLYALYIYADQTHSFPFLKIEDELDPWTIDHTAHSTTSKNELTHSHFNLFEESSSKMSLAFIAWQ
jgi:hypothetical protein